MKEVIPVLIGVVLALGCERIASAGLRRAAWVAGSVVAGVAVTFVTGEWFISPGFVLIDVPLVAFGAVVARTVVLRMARNTGRSGDNRFLAPYCRSPVTS